MAETGKYLSIAVNLFYLAAWVVDSIQFFQDSSRILPGFFQDSSKFPFRFLSGFFQDSFRILLEFFQDSFKILPGIFQDSSRILFRHLKRFLLDYRSLARIIWNPALRMRISLPPPSLPPLSIRSFSVTSKDSRRSYTSGHF